MYYYYYYVLFYGCAYSLSCILLHMYAYPNAACSFKSATMFNTRMDVTFSAIIYFDTCLWVI